MQQKLNGFRDEYYFLSNFSEYPVYYNGIYYRNSEAAFQAQKTLDTELQWKFTKMSPRTARTEGKKINLRPDWEKVKDGIMKEILHSKFSNPILRYKLLETKGMLLEETNGWHDNYWGNCTCNACMNIPGKNKLGLFLMDLREELEREDLCYDEQRE